MIIGYAIIAVPTGIITVELSKIKSLTKNCNNCGRENTENANYCNQCGEKLPV
jgi:voltage-gated potassium channel